MSGSRKISAFPDGTPIEADDAFVVERVADGYNYKLTAEQVAAYFRQLNGQQIIFIEGESGEDGVGIPGTPGAQGAAGTNGTIGRDGQIVYLEADTPEEPMVIPGARGIDGAAGTSGTIGRDGVTIYLEPDQPEEPMLVPGPAGTNGTNGAGGGTKGTTTVNFGAKETSVSVTVASAGIAANSVVSANLLPAATASNTADNHWFDNLQVMAGSIVAGVGFTIYASCKTGVAHGIYNIGWTYN